MEGGTYIITVPATRRPGPSQVGDEAVRARAVVVEACLNRWTEVRCSLVRASAERSGERATGAILGREEG
jgi:hypothetical protein